MRVTQAQIETIKALADAGGWATSRQIVDAGGNPSSAHALVRIGFAEVRDVESIHGYQRNEWRLTEQGWAA